MDYLLINDDIASFSTDCLTRNSTRISWSYKYYIEVR